MEPIRKITNSVFQYGGKVFSKSKIRGVNHEKIKNNTKNK